MSSVVDERLTEVREAYRMLGYVQTARALRDVDLWPDATDPVLS